MKKYKLLLAILLFVLAVPTSEYPLVQAAKKKTQQTQQNSVWPKCPSIDAEACCVMELSSGLILYSKNMKKKNYPASITKIMTTLLAIENCSLGEEVTFSAQAVNSIPWDGTKLGVLSGEKLSIEQSLYAIMLHSANDVSAGVAEYISGSDAEFAKLMTKRAKEIGCVNTNFTNPHGLHDDNHYTCAYDMCLIGREAMKNSIFRKVTASRTYTVGKTNKSDARTINNHHQMINGYRTNYAYEYDRVIGGKTGYTSMAENTLVTLAKKDDMEIICVVMRAQSNNYRENQYTDTRKLIDAAFDNYKLYPMAGSVDTDSESAVSDDSPMFTKYSPLMSETNPAITVEGNSYIILPKNVKKNKAKQTITYFNTSTPSEDNNYIIGEVSYSFDEKNVGSAHIIYHPQTAPQLYTAVTATPVISFKDRLTTSITHKISAHKTGLIITGIILGIIIIVLLAFLIYSNISYQQNRKRSRKTYYMNNHKKRKLRRR